MDDLEKTEFIIRFTMIGDLTRNTVSISTMKESAKIFTNRYVRGYVIAAQKQIYSSVNSAMVTAYWNIGKQIYEACGENDRATYGKQLLRYLSEKLTEEFGKGFDERNLRNMRQFYLTFPIRNSLRSELSWTHYRSLMKVKDDAARNFYLEEAVKSGWSSRQLDRQINSFYYQRIPYFLMDSCNSFI